MFGRFAQADLSRCLRKQKAIIVLAVMLYCYILARVVLGLLPYSTANLKSEEPKSTHHRFIFVDVLY